MTFLGGPFDDRSSPDIGMVYDGSLFHQGKVANDNGPTSFDVDLRISGERIQFSCSHFLLHKDLAANCGADTYNRKMILQPVTHVVVIKARSSDIAYNHLVKSIEQSGYKLRLGLAKPYQFQINNRTIDGFQDCSWMTEFSSIYSNSSLAIRGNQFHMSQMMPVGTDSWAALIAASRRGALLDRPADGGLRLGFKPVRSFRQAQGHLTSQLHHAGLKMIGRIDAGNRLDTDADHYTEAVSTLDFLLVDVLVDVKLDESHPGNRIPSLAPRVDLLNGKHSRVVP